MKTTFVRVFKVFIGLILSNSVFAQDGENMNDVLNKLDGRQNVISTAVPFLTIAPDSKAGGMGEVGAATPTDVWSMHWNPSKYAFSNKDVIAGLSYTPWLRNLGISDMNLIYGAASYKVDKKQAVSISLLYFSLGEITFYDEDGNNLDIGHSPKEYSIDAAYSRLLSDNFSFSLAGRFINTNLIGNLNSDSKPGRAIAADISGYYKKKIKIQEYPALLSLGFNISNIGSKISYSEGGEKDFIPTNLKIGGGLSSDIDQYNAIGVYFDINKLLVPTPAFRDEDGEIVEGRDPEVAPIQGVIQSFYDAPGGWKEEIHELQYSLGMEYWYAKQFAVRGGYFHEHETKGNRKFFSLGIGLRLNVVGIDFSYLIPTQGKNSPLANTLRFSLTFDFEGLKAENAPIETEN